MRTGGPGAVPCATPCPAQHFLPNFTPCPAPHAQGSQGRPLPAALQWRACASQAARPIRRLQATLPHGARGGAGEGVPTGEPRVAMRGRATRHVHVLARARVRALACVLPSGCMHRWHDTGAFMWLWLRLPQMSGQRAAAG